MKPEICITDCDKKYIKSAISLLIESANKYFFEGVEENSQAAFLKANTLENALTLQRQGFHFLAAKVTGTFVGFVSVSPHGHIHQHFVSQTSQNKGIGSKLLKAALKLVQTINGATKATVAASQMQLGFMKISDLFSSMKNSIGMV